MDKKFIKGNEAVAEAAVRAGCRFFSGYPITPQNEIPEYLSRRLPEVGGTFIQAESEVSAINMVFGAAYTGTLAMTSSSGPGLSLKSEGISTLAAAELPAVIVNVMRGGPGIGTIQAAQMDYLQATKASGHGGFRMLVYAPSTVQEAVDLTYKAFFSAVKYQNPVLVLMDGCIGAMMEGIELPEAATPVRKNYKFIGSEVYNPNRQVVTSCLLDPIKQEILNKKAAAMYEGWTKDEIMVEEYMVEDAEVIIAAYGTSARTAKTAIKSLREQGIKVGLIKPITLYPFPYESLNKLDYGKVKFVLDVEMSIPLQMVEDIQLGVLGRAPIKCFGRSAGVMITSEDIVEEVIKLTNKGGEVDGKDL